MMTLELDREGAAELARHGASVEVELAPARGVANEVAASGATRGADGLDIQSSQLLQSSNREFVTGD